MGQTFYLEKGRRTHRKEGEKNSEKSRRTEKFFGTCVREQEKTNVCEN